MEHSANPPAGPEADAGDGMKRLRGLVHAIAIAMFILTGTFGIFLYRQVILVRQQTAELVNFMMEYERSNTSEVIQELRGRLGEFARSNPDFRPVYVRYFGTNQPSQGSPSKITPAPARPE